MIWNTVLNELDRIHPFFKRLSVSRGEGLPGVKIPPILKTSTSAAIKMVDEDNSSRRAAIVFPKILDCAKWAATGAALSIMHDDFVVNYERLPNLIEGARLALDRPNCIVEYEGEDEAGLLVLKLDGSAVYKIPPRQRIRLQPTTSNRPLASRIPKSMKPPVIDEILDIGTLGNRSFFKSSVILVSSIIKSKAWAQHTYASFHSNKEMPCSVPVINLFQWGGLNQNGNIELWGSGQLECEPVLIVASDLYAVEEYLTAHDTDIELILLEGENSFSKSRQNLDDIIDSGLPVMAFINSSETEAAKMLRDRGFDLLTWTTQDLNDHILLPHLDDNHAKESNPFFSLQKTLSNFSCFSVKERICRHDHLNDIEIDLFDLDRAIADEHHHLKGLLGQLYGCTLSISRLLIPRACPEAAELKNRIEKQLETVEVEFKNNRVWLSPDAYNRAISLISKLRSALYSIELGEPKIEAFKEIIEQQIASGARLLGILTGGETETDKATAYWKQHFASLQQNLTDACEIRFYSASTFDESLDFDALIVSGWLGARKMFGLLHSYAAPEIWVLVNDFEKRWMHSARSKWRRNAITQTDKARTKLLGVTDETDLSPESESLKPDLPQETVDISEFELRLRYYKRQVLAAKRIQGEDTIDARFVEFSDGYFAFLSEGYHIPVVTDYIVGATETGDIPQRTIGEIKAGAFLLFREGAEGNLIRAVADMGLEASGKLHLRQTSSLWRKALRTYRDRLNGDTSTVVEAIRDGGCRKTKFTIRSWINNEYKIGPRSDQDLEIIAAVTGDKELKSRLAEVRQAIGEVRGAHLQASGFLIRKLLEVIPSHLGKSSNLTLSLEIEGIGKAVVVRVEEISDEVVSVGYSRANRLLKEVIDTSWHV